MSSVRNRIEESNANNQYAVILPCTQEDFGNFISGLLGKPQTLERSVLGSFEIGRSEIESTFHLVDQRIKQQNNGTLIQFSIKIIYSDDTAVTLNHIDDFGHYNEVQPLIVTAVHLTWIYLIKFQDKKFPEKQQIDVSITASNYGDYYRRQHLLTPDIIYSRRGGIHIRISHTARTWGIDIDSLLDGHFKMLMSNEGKLKRFIYENNEAIGVSTGVVFFITSLIGAYLSLRQAIHKQVLSAQQYLGTGTDVQNVNNKIDYLIQAISQGKQLGMFNGMLFALIISFALSIVIMIIIGVLAGNEPESFLLLSKKTKEMRDEHIKKRDRRWLYLILSAISSLITGVLSKVIFSAYFEH